MSFTLVDETIAKTKLQHMHATLHTSQFITLWKTYPLLISYNHLDKNIFNVYYQRVLDDDEFECIENIVREYFLSVED